MKVGIMEKNMPLVQLHSMKLSIRKLSFIIIFQIDILCKSIHKYLVASPTEYFLIYFQVNMHSMVLITQTFNLVGVSNCVSRGAQYA